MKKLGRIAALLLVLSLVLVPGAHAAGKGKKVYSAPYQEGPTAGDQWAMSTANTDDGRIFVGRAYPIFNPISCAPGGGMAKLQVTHKVTKKISKVSAAYDFAAVDPYTFVTLSVRTKKGKWLAGTRQRGPIVGSGVIEAPLFDGSPKRGKKVLVQFGLEMASACPQVNGGSAQFTEITVS